MFPNINSLVQAGCGGANPLVAASQMIATAPSSSSTSTGASTATFPMDTTANFAAEFMQQQHYLPPEVAQPQAQQLQRPIHLHQPLYQSFFNLQLQEPGSSARTSTAAEQLEAKYRSEVLEAQEDTNLDVDKMSIWQMLSLLCTGTVDKAERIRTIADREDPSGHSFPISPYRIGNLIDLRVEIRNSPDDLMRWGLRLFEQGNFWASSGLFEDLTTLEPDNAIAWRYSAISKDKIWCGYNAEENYQKCLSFGFDGEAKLRLARNRTQRIGVTESCDHLFEWLANNEKYKSLDLDADKFQTPTSPKKTVIMHKFWYLHDKLLEAARLSAQIPDPDVQTALGLLNQGTITFPDRQAWEFQQKAIDCFKVALSVKPNDVDLWLDLSRSLGTLKNLEEALIASKRALQLEPLNPTCHREVSYNLEKLGMNYLSFKQCLNEEKIYFISHGDDWDETELLVSAAASFGQKAMKNKLLSLDLTRFDLNAATKDYLNQRDS